MLENNIQKGIIQFVDILGESGKKYDKWFASQEQGYYLTYKQNLYSDLYDYSVEQKNSPTKQPLLLSNDITAITGIIDTLIEKEQKKHILKLKFIGIDNWDRPVYKDEKGNLYKDVNLGAGKDMLNKSLCSVCNNDFYGEPYCPINENITIKLINNGKVREER